MARRKTLAQREPNGRPQRRHREVELPPPTETRRLMDAAVAGMRPAEWGTMLGRLYLAGRITETQYAAGRRWCRIVEDHTQALLSPRLPRSATLDPSGGSSLDPDSATGIREARRHARMVEAYEAGIEVLKRAGTMSNRVVSAVCERDQAPAGWSEVDALRIGLQTLAAFWSAQGQRKPMEAKPMQASQERARKPGAIAKP